MGYELSINMRSEQEKNNFKEVLQRKKNNG